MMAIPDAGARVTLLSDAAARLGLNAPVFASTASGIDGQRVTLLTLQVWPDVARNMLISVSDL